MSQKQKTAEIIPFPQRRARPGQREQGTAITKPKPSLPTVSFGSGWYHDAAIQDANQQRKR